MHKSKFREPVVVPASNGMCELATVHDAWRAVSQGQIGGFCLDHPEWHMTMNALVAAMREGTPERIEAARKAVEALAWKTAPKH
jgi:hypothetical protein